jgi:CHASE3 domain sensor protein
MRVALLITPVLLVVLLAVGFGVYTNIHNTNVTEGRNTKMDLYLRTNSKYISYAESAQRGYLLTGESKYRDSITLDFNEIKKNEEYYTTLPEDMKGDNIVRIQKISQHKMSRLMSTVLIYEAGQRDSALAIVKTGTGSRMMDSIRSATTIIRTELTDEVALARQRGNYLFTLFLILIAVLIVFTSFLVWYTYRKFNDYTNSLETAVSSLQQANDRMAQYTKMSYHELKTPLRNIGGFAQLLKRRYAHEENDEEGNQFVLYITDGIKQMNDIINDMRAKYLDSSVDEIDL